MVEAQSQAQAHTFTDAQGKKKKIRVALKQAVFYSQDYSDKARHERARIVEKE
jgi:hypothetical protein